MGATDNLCEIIWLDGLFLLFNSDLRRSQKLEDYTEKYALNP